MRAAIFDMDGLLIDSEPLWRQAEIEVFAELDIDLTHEDCMATTGLRTDEVVAHWYRRFPWRQPSRQAVTDAIDGRVAKLISIHGTALPGALNAVGAVHRAGLALGLASSSSHDLIEAVVQKLELERYFTALCSAADEALGKPDPAVYLATARELDVAPIDCVAFEDSLAGVESARTAGMRVIVVPAPSGFDDPGFDAADLKLHSLEEFSIDLLATL